MAQWTLNLYKRKVDLELCPFYCTGIMATFSQWDVLLNQKYRIYQVEESVYVNSSQKANGPEMYAKFICDALRKGDVPESLQRLYEEAVYGTEERVKLRIRNRMYLIGRHVRCFNFAYFSQFGSFSYVYSVLVKVKWKQW